LRVHSTDGKTIDLTFMDNRSQDFDKRECELFLRDQRTRILRKFTSTAPVDHSEAEKAMGRVYQILERPIPKFKWVDTPWMVTQTALEDHDHGQTFLISKAEEKIGHRVRKTLEESISRAVYNEYFQLQWDDLPVRQVRSLAAHLEAERLSLRGTDWNSVGQTQTIRHFSFFRQQNNFRFSSWNLDVEWATETLIRLALAQSARDFFNVPLIDEDKEQLDCFLAVGNTAHAYRCFDDCCILSEGPIELHVDEESRLHNAGGAAVRYKGMPEIYSWHGSRVPIEAIVNEPTLASIDCESNVAVRRVLIERYGVENYLLDSGAEIRHYDQCGTLYVTELHNDENIAMVRVTNSTPEPDGQFRTYFLRVPPNITTAREAVAWTFGLTSAEYNPHVES